MSQSNDDMSVMSVMKLLPATLTEQQTFVSEVLNFVLEGNVNPIEIETYFKAIETVAGAIRKNPKFKECLMDEVDKHPGREFRYGNAIIVSASRTTYDYSDDEEWKKLDAKRKKREAFLKNLDREMADPETGELIRPAIPKKSEFLKIRFDDNN